VCESAKLVRPQGQIYCPECESLFVLDDRNEATRRELDEARDARLRRRYRLRDMRARWTDPAPVDIDPIAPEVSLLALPPQAALTPPVSRPMLIGDVLKTLDALLDKLNCERTSGTGKAA
jgi:hypothetical protein